MRPSIPRLGETEFQVEVDLELERRDIHEVDDELENYGESAE